MEEEVKKKRKYTKIPKYAKEYMEYMEHRKLLARDVETNYKNTLVKYFNEPYHIIPENIFIYLHKMVKDLYEKYILPNIEKEFINPVDIELLNSITYKSFAKLSMQYMQFYNYIKYNLETYDTERHSDHNGNMVFLLTYYFLTHDAKK